MHLKVDIRLKSMVSKKKKNENFIGCDRTLPEVEKLLEEYKHLDQSDDFVGSQFKTPKGGVLTVVGWDGNRYHSNKNFTIHCSICSKDEELFPSISSIKKNLIKKPCTMWLRF